MKTVDDVINRIDLLLAQHYGAVDALETLAAQLRAQPIDAPATSVPIVPAETAPSPVETPAPTPRAPRAARTAPAAGQAGNIPAKLDAVLSRELPGVDIDLGNLLRNAGIDGGSKSFPYKTAMSAVARYVKRGLLTRSGRGSVRLTAPWQPAGAPALTHEHRLANERVGMAS